MLLERIPRCYTAIWHCDNNAVQSNLGAYMTIHSGIDLDYSPTITNLHYYWTQKPRFIPPQAKAVILYCNNVSTNTSERIGSEFSYKTTSLLISISLEDILKPAVGPGYGPFYMTNKTGDDLTFRVGYDCFFDISATIDVYKEFDSNVKGILTFNLI